MTACFVQFQKNERVKNPKKPIRGKVQNKENLNINLDVSGQMERDHINVRYVTNNDGIENLTKHH